MEAHRYQWTKLKELLDNICGKTLGEADKRHVFERTKKHPKITGIAGDVIEQSVLGYPADCHQRPDLNIDGELVELKTTGLRRIATSSRAPKSNSNEMNYEAKEPASITAVSIENIVKEDDFEESAFWHKARALLFVFYVYDSKTTVLASMYADFPILGYCLHRFEPDETAIIRKDWESVRDFLRKIHLSFTRAEDRKKQYPRLSTELNKELVFLDTAPKYPHPPRFRLRKRIVTLIFEKSFNNKLEILQNQKIFTRYSEFEKKCKEIESLYAGQSLAKIMSSFGIAIARDEEVDICSKNYAEQAVVLMFGGKSPKMSQIKLFREFGYVGHTVAVTTKNKRTEDMKLNAVDFNELAETEFFDEDINKTRAKEFEDSDLYSYLHDNKLLCIVFRETEKESAGNKVKLKNNIFVGFRIIDLSNETIMSAARDAWARARELILNGELANVPVLDKNGVQRYTPKTHLPMFAPNLPKAKDGIVFFRGSGSDARNKNIVVNDVMMYRQNYWISGAYICDNLAL